MATAESITTEFAFHVEYVDEDNRVLRDQRLRSIDFGHAIRHTHFDAFRRGLVDHYQLVVTRARIEPLFSTSDASSPRAKGFRATVPTSDGGEHVCEFGISYLGSLANRVVAELLRTGGMTAEEKLYYRLHAFLDDEQISQPTQTLGISLEAPQDTVAIASGCRRDFGPVEAWDEPTYSDLPILIDRGVLEEIVDEARAHPEVEIAGFLLGHLNRDEQTKELFVVITGLASSIDTTQASGTSVTYTPASFSHVRNIIRLRAADEIVCGSYHSHPFKLCAECPLPTPSECINKVLFYSQDDIHLMETTFEQPYMVGAVAAIDLRIEEAIGHLPLKLYGWQQGEIKARGFEVVQSKAEARAPALMRHGVFPPKSG